jgi:hypothetical protein
VPPRSSERRYPSLPKHQLVAVIMAVATMVGITAAIMEAGTMAGIMEAGTAAAGMGAVGMEVAGMEVAGTAADTVTAAAADAIGFRDPMVGNGAAGKRWNALYPTL